MSVGVECLKNPNRKKGDRTKVAALLGVHPRTLNRWMQGAGAKRLGRPPHPDDVYQTAKPQVLELLRTLGFKTGRGTVLLIYPDLPVRVVSVVLRIVKAEHAAETRQRIAANQVHTEVLAAEAMLAQDSTHTGNDHGRKAWAETAKDAATFEAEAWGNGKALTANAMLAFLGRLQAENRLPLVLANDNGSGYKDQRVAAKLRELQVIQLFSLPHTPQHNARAERGIGEGKELAHLGKGVDLESGRQGVRDLNQAFKTLNQRWPRQSKGGLTATQLKQTLPHWRQFTSRGDFYNAACSAIAAITGGTKREQRIQTREAIFRTLEQFGLILRTRGEHKEPYVNRDNIL